MIGKFLHCLKWVFLLPFAVLVIFAYATFVIVVLPQVVVAIGSFVTGVVINFTLEGADYFVSRVLELSVIIGGVGAIALFIGSFLGLNLAAGFLLGGMVGGAIALLGICIGALGARVLSVVYEVPMQTANDELAFLVAGIAVVCGIVGEVAFWKSEGIIDHG